MSYFGSWLQSAFVAASARSKAPEDCRSPKAGAVAQRARSREASWTAAVPCRFSFAGVNRAAPKSATPKAFGGALQNLAELRTLSGQRMPVGLTDKKSGRRR